jgi:hypothetical protein
VTSEAYYYKGKIKLDSERSLCRTSQAGKSNYWESADWVWDGREFRLSSVSTSPGLCRFTSPDTVWDFPTFVTDVVNEDGTPRNWD